MQKRMTKKAKMKLNRTNMKRTITKMKTKFDKIRPQKARKEPILAARVTGPGPFFFHVQNEMISDMKKKGLWPRRNELAPLTRTGGRPQEAYRRRVLHRRGVLPGGV